MAKDIFDKTIFDGYRVESLTESAQDIIPKYNFDGSTKTTVFISHKHDDLDEIKGLIGLLERKYNIKAYIDSLDKSMPKKTSGETASKIKQRINRCNKFILLATNGVRRHIVGGANRTLFSVDLPPRLCRTGTCRRLQTE